MEQQDSIKGELQTLIALEQQQNQTLDAIHSKGAFNPTMSQVNSFGFGQSHYMPNSGGFQKIPIVGEYANQINDTLNYAASGFDSGMNQLNNLQQRVRNAAVSGRVDSSNWVTANQSKLSLEARELKGANLGEKLATGTLSATSMLAGAGIKAAGGIFGGAIGGAAVGVVADIGIDQVKQNFAYNKYLLQNSYRFINPFESNNDRNVAGFNRSERWNTSNWLRKFNTSMKISDNDTMTLLQGFTEGDLLRDVSDVDTFKKKMTDLTKSVKTMALSLNETYEEVVQTMADLKKAGLNTRDYKSIAGLGKITASFTGQDAGDVIDYQKNLSTALTNGTSLDINKTMSLVQNTESFLGALYSNAEKNYNNSDEAKLLYNRFNNRGGVEGATSDYLQLSKEMLGTNGTWFNQSGAAFYNWNAAKGEWEFSQEDYNALKNSSLTEINKVATNKMNAAGATAIQKWTNNSGNIMMGDFGDDLQKLADLFNTITSAAKKVAGMEGWDTEAAMENLFGLEGEDTKFMAMTTDAINSNPELHGKIKAMGFAQTMVDDLMSERAGFGYEVKNSWNKFKDAVGDIFQPVGSGLSSAGQGISDWWYGKPYDINSLRERWGNMDWESSPTKGISNALAEYASAIKAAGNTDSDVAKLFGVTRNGDIGTRNVYSVIDKLEKALEGLADNVTDYAEVIQRASENSNVSENVAAAAVNALNITDNGVAKNIISQIGSYKNQGFTENDALKKVLSDNNLSNDTIENTINSLYTSGSKFFADAQENYLAEDARTSKYFGNTKDKAFSKSANLSDSAKFLFGNVNTDAGMAELLGLDVNVSDSWLDTHTDNDISFSDRMKINQNALAYISETAALMQNMDRWNSLTFQEQTDRLNAVYLGAPLLEQNGLTSGNIQLALQNNESFRDLYTGYASDTKKNLGWTGNKLIVDEYLLNSDEKKEYYKKKTGKEVREESTAPGVYGATSSESWIDFLNSGASGMYDSDTPDGAVVSKYMNLSLDEATKAIEEDNKKLGEELKNLGTKRVNLAQKIIDSVTDPAKKKEITDLILGNGGATADQLRKYGLSGKNVDEYIAANESYNNVYSQIEAGENLKSEYHDTEIDSDARASAYLMLGKAVGVDAKKLRAMKKSLTDFNKMSSADIEAQFANSQDIIAEAMFGTGIVGTTVTEENRSQIIKNLTNSLLSSGSLNSDQVSGAIEQFANSYLQDGSTITKNSVDTFTRFILDGITNGNMATPEASLKKSIDSLTESVDKATETMQGIPFWKDKSEGESSTNNTQSTNISTGYTNVPTNLNYNQNGTSTSTSGGRVSTAGNSEQRFNSMR